MTQDHAPDRADPISGEGDAAELLAVGLAAAGLGGTYAVAPTEQGDAIADERARIRRELEDAIESETWTYVPARGQRLGVLSADAMKAHLDRICPK